MTSRTLNRLLRLLPLFLLIFFGARAVSSAQSQVLPNPVLYLTHTELFKSGSKQMVRYKYDVFNKSSYPADFFAASPQLPPCGKNTKAARTWVDIYDQTGKKLNSFCALAKPADLNGIWFALEETAVPPSWVYIELTDRKTTTKYKSNLAETSM